MKHKKALVTISILTILLGILVIFGWFFNISILKSVLPGYETMKFNTAIYFIIAGVAFNLILNGKFRGIYLTLSVILVLLGLLGVLQDILNRDLGVDKLFLSFKIPSAPNTPHPERMAPTTSLGFIFLGLSFICITRKTYKIAGQYLLHLITLLAFIAITGYLLNVPTLYKLSFFSSMAIHTSIAFFVLSIAASMVNPEIGITGLFSGKLIGNRIARRMFPVMVLVIFVLTAARMATHRYHMVSVEFGITLFAVSFVVVGLFLIWDTAILLNKIDLKRQKAENELVIANKSLEDKVNQRTSELSIAMEKSQTAEANLRAVFNAAQVSIIETDPNGIIKSFNKGAEAMLGYRAEEVMYTANPDFIHLEQEITDRGDELTEIFGREIRGNDVFKELAKRGQYDSRRWTYVRKDSSTLPVQLVVTAITADDGELKGFLGIATDISELELAKSELEILVDYLQGKNEQLLHFAQIISHNLRSPVSNLKTILYLYKESDDEEEKTSLMENFEAVVNILISTLNELVDSLKTEKHSGKEREWINFEEVFNKILQMFVGSIKEHNAIVTADFSKAPKIEYPRSYLESIMLNLFSNALKYKSPKRTPKIKISTENNDEGLILKVIDNGLGMDLKKIGNNLFGLNQTFHRHAEAKGLGLFMTKIQVESMGGHIVVESEVNKGTTFKVVLQPKLHQVE